MPGCCISGECPRYTLNRRLGGPRNPSGNLEEKKNFIPLKEIEKCQIQKDKLHKKGSELLRFDLTSSNARVLIAILSGL